MNYPDCRDVLAEYGVAGAFSQFQKDSFNRHHIAQHFGKELSLAELQLMCFQTR
ncbi:hypothetical protein [Celerinatantimonas sp. YJH-8]|uniref:hypothetical protein n=1 Tax=Celerinatantimonas sp. YJH-8 TaxID=3228714 RepID=UPI0038C73249